MITREEDEDLSSSTKQESDNINNTNFMVSSRPSSSSSAAISSWSKSKDLRIVRVSKAFGGKDRHSKVCTVKGLRDRRVRLSIPTALQLYDLQDRLGLNQPSKVVDWLLNAAKDEIDELPPLQIPPPGLNFPPNLHYSMLMAANNANASSSSSHHQAADNNRDEDDDGIEENLRARSKEIKDEKSRNEEMENLDLERQHHQNGGYATLSTSDFLQKPSNNPSPVQGLMNHNSLAYNNSSFLRWDPSNLSLSHHQPEDNDNHQQFQNFNNNSNVPLHPSTVDIIPSGSQVVLYPSYGVSHPHQSYFDLQMLSSNSHNPLSPNSLSQHHVESSSHNHNNQQEAPQPLRPFHFSVMANFLPSSSHLNGGNKTNNDDEYESR